MQGRRKGRIIELSILAVVLILALGIKLTDHYLSNDQDTVLNKTSVDSMPEDRVGGEETGIDEPEDMIMVHVTGAVNESGVYELPRGSRLTDAVKMAGGLTDQADTSSINLAQMVYDTQKIVIYKIGEAPKSSEPNPIGQWTLQDLNEADAERLMEINGIGEQMAGRILDHKKENGPFHSVDDLIAVKGIGEKKLASIKEVFESNKK